MENSRTPVRGPATNQPEAEVPAPAEARGEQLDTQADDDIVILVREISKNRLGQADIGQRNLIQFLGFDPNAQINSLFVQKVELDNTLGPVSNKKYLC